MALAIILIIEDDTLISSQIESAINTINRATKILKTNNGKQALEIANTMDIDLFIIDIGLPDCNGIELAKIIRKTYPRQPIIVESSQDDMAYRAQIHDQIENLAFLSKPFNNEKMIVKVKHALDIIENMSVKQLKIKQTGYSRLISIDEILYIEKVKGKKKIEMTLYNQDSKQLTKEEFVSITLNSLLDMLEDTRDLIRCHKGFIINPKMINKLNYAENTISLNHTDTEIPIGKTYKKKIGLIL